MANRIEVEAADGGTLRVVIRSENERDQSAITDATKLRGMIDAAEASRPGENVQPAESSGA